MKIVFFGTSEFAVPTLRALRERHAIARVVTQPDRPAGRGKRLTPTPVRRAAEELGLPVFTPERAATTIDELAADGADVFVVVSYGQILPQALLDVPPLGAFNVHPSALPLYRGANPIAAPIRDGRAATALAIIRMDAGMDTGDVVFLEPTPIAPTETGTALHDRLAARGAEAMLVVLDRAARGELQARPQSAFPDAPEEIAATRTRPVRTDDLLVDWTRDARAIVDLVRAYAEAPAARAEIAGERVKVLAATVGEPTDAPPGTPLGVKDAGLGVAAGDGRAVILLSLIPPGRSRQSGAEFARRLRKTSP